jgi:hypothetical protein
MPIRPQCFKALSDLRDKGLLDPTAAVDVLERFYPDAQRVSAEVSADGLSTLVRVHVGDRYDQESFPPAPPPPEEAP